MSRAEKSQPKPTKVGKKNISRQHTLDLITNNLRSPEGILLPTYFENDGQNNLSASVYVQVIPTLLVGKSIRVIRGLSVLITMIAAVSLGLIHEIV